MITAPGSLSTEVLDILPNPVLVKNQQLEYVWINKAFENLFSVKREKVIGKLDVELFPDRQVSQCNGGDLRVLENGVVDEAVETVFEKTGIERQTITRKSRLIISESEIYLVGVMHDITAITRANEALTKSQQQLEEQAIELSILATTDAMTGCANRRTLVEVERSLLANEDLSTAILVLDIDKIKSINDNYGHDCGDSVLRNFCDVVRSVIKTSDHFIRLGGEEFAITLTNLTPLEAEIKANEIRQQIHNTPLLTKKGPLAYTVSIGVAFKDTGETAKVDDMLGIADKNLYIAKNCGRNLVVLAA